INGEPIGSIKSVTIPDSVTSIDYGTLRGFGGLESLTIPFVGGSADATEASSSTLFGYIFGSNSYDGGTQIQQYYGTYGFSYCTYYISSSLKNITVTGGSILYGAFQNCSGLTDLTIGDNVTNIGYNVLTGCSESLRIHINGTTLIGNIQFALTYKDKGDKTFTGSFSSDYPTEHIYTMDTQLVTPTRAGYEFAGWYLNKQCSGESITEIGRYSITGDTTIYAKWSNGENTIVFSVPVYEDIVGLLTYNNTSGTFTAMSGMSQYAWYIDNTKQSAATSEFTPDTTDLTAGKHSVTVTVTDSSGNRYSAESEFTVRKTN
ncbi:MAG: InlB B-repeat-containing protein, partial [Spirochaetales bacterium]|nr:InlB B-repeat-containing protein [Spirochaetales bacterium]